VVAVTPQRLLASAAAAMLLFGCLPDRYSDEDLTAKIAAATDGKTTDTGGQDSSANQLDAQQVQFAPTPGFQQAVLPSLPESCYGYSEPDAQCTGASSAPWCAK